MIDFKQIDFSPGTVVDMVGQVAMVTAIWTNDNKLYVNVIFPRNVGRSLDLLVFTQEKAMEMQVDKWHKLEPEAFSQELNAVLKKTDGIDCKCKTE